MDSSASGRLQLHKLLDPLRRLHSLKAAEIDGPLSASYKSNMITDLSKKCPNAMDIIGNATLMLAQGDELALQDLSFDAIDQYKTALDHVRSCCWVDDEQAFVADSGLFPGLTAKQTMGNLKVRLLARIASIYFQRSMLRMARIYVERALNPHHGIEHYHLKTYRLDLRPWRQVVYAEVLHVSAHFWYAYGHIWEAINDLCKVEQYVELSKEQQSTLEAWQRHHDQLSERYTKKSETRKIRRQKERFNTEGQSTLVGFIKFANDLQKSFL